MRIVVPMKAVPDLVEEIELNPGETDIDREFLSFILSEWDAQALEEALLVKDASGAEVVAVGLAADPDIDQALYTALAKGADAAGLHGLADPADRRIPRRLPGCLHAEHRGQDDLQLMGTATGELLPHADPVAAGLHADHHGHVRLG